MKNIIVKNYCNFLKLYLWAFYAFIVRRQWRDDRKVLIGKGPQGGNRTWVAVSAVALYVDAPTKAIGAKEMIALLMGKD